MEISSGERDKPAEESGSEEADGNEALIDSGESGHECCSSICEVEGADLDAAGDESHSKSSLQ